LCGLTFVCESSRIQPPDFISRRESDWSMGGAYYFLERSLDESSVSQERHGTLLNLDLTVRRNSGWMKFSGSEEFHGLADSH